ncbi:MULTISPECIES: helix-turn-helix domain-containing protein [Nocardiopsis]|uniref:Transcriptional regulator with XRE-family HTH domain n=1 Tax=Nocardiopsis sinuspersici TaxID=501010 RepID=A0A1V3C651_9ACTN|nr:MULTISPECIES: helix-turn-helix transcriptional regulator [Nocardiopsis]NYH52827.1 transcriptional regulator with XRE-family HTH domain [Nocardiopsis sinuspersici]OOC56225.1 hypothetical protein NOSIN_22330 [Nocardiopsis sinuspersici]
MDEPRKSEWVRFGLHLKRLRTQQGLSLNRLADRAEWSATYLGKLENAKRAPNADVVRDLDRELRTNGALLRAWNDVVRAQAALDWYEQSRGYEKRAHEIRFFHPLVVPGFFQTPEYARVIVTHTVPTASEKRIQNVIRTRESWRKDLDTDGGLVLNVILTELALTRPIASEVMREQLDRLIQEAERPTVTLQVLPSGISDLAWLSGAFRLVYIEGEQPLLCAEHAIGEYLTDDEQETRKMETVFSKLQAWALPPDVTARKLGEMRQAL